MQSDILEVPCMQLLKCLGPMILAITYPYLLTIYLCKMQLLYMPPPIPALTPAVKTATYRPGASGETHGVGYTAHPGGEGEVVIIAVDHACSPAP